MAEDTKNFEEGLETKEQAPESAAANSQEGMSLEDINNFVSFCENNDEKRMILIEMLNNLRDSTDASAITTLMSLSKAFAGLDHVRGERQCLQAALVIFRELRLAENAALLFQNRRDIFLPLVTTFFDQGKTCTASRKFDEASVWLTDALEMQQQLYGPDGQELVHTLMALADTSFNPAVRQAHLHTALEIQRKHGEPNDPLLISLLEKLGKSYNASGKFNEALAFLEPAEAHQSAHYRSQEALQGLEEGTYYQLNDPQLVSILMELGRAYAGLEHADHADKAEQCLEHALAILGRDYASNHERIHKILVKLEDVYGLIVEKHGEEGAFDRLKQVCSTREKHYGRNHILVALALRTLARFHDEAPNVGNWNEEVRLLEEALAIQKLVEVPDQEVELSKTRKYLDEAYRKLKGDVSQNECLEELGVRPSADADDLYGGDSKEEPKQLLPIVISRSTIAPGSASTRHHLLADVRRELFGGAVDGFGRDASQEDLEGEEESRLLQLAISASLEGMQGGPH